LTLQPRIHRLRFQREDAQHALVDARQRLNRSSASMRVVSHQNLWLVRVWDEFASRVQAGVVWCNTYNKFDPASPFGGYKESGFGREGGVHGLAAYVAF
jgi:acyl-CoA reductase-like NAD-dependent aldehyde dehydrogenase